MPHGPPREDISSIAGLGLRIWVCRFVSRGKKYLQRYGDQVTYIQTQSGSRGLEAQQRLEGLIKGLAYKALGV